MKKQLFLGLAAITSVTVSAQHTFKMATNAKVKNSNVNKYSNTAYEPVFTPPSKKQGSLLTTQGAPYKRIGGSNNLYTAVSSEHRCLQYNEALHTVGLAYRQNTNTWTGIPNINANTASGTVAYAWSSNNGSSWDSTIVSGDLTHQQRHPSGVIYNPSGNTTPSNAYALMSGPWHPGSAWQGVYRASKQLTTPGTNSNTVADFVDNNALTATQKKQDYSNNDPQVTADGAVHILGQIYGDINATPATVASATWRGAMLNKALFSAGTFTWTVDSLKPNFKLDGTSKKSGFTGYANMAWSESGTIGYVVFYGVDANAIAGTSQNSFQPYVYKTTDAGVSWNRFSPLFDFTTLPALNSRIFAHGTSTGKPFITASEGGSATVDAAGNLHVFASMVSAWSDNLDSLGFTISPNFNSSWNYIADFKTTSTGWDVVVIDSLQTEGADARRTPWTASAAAGGNSATDARLQISRTTDGKNIFYSWADSDFTLVADSSNKLPDIFQIGYDVIADKFTCKKNMTLGKIGVEKDAFYFYSSPIVAKPSGTTFRIPTSFVKSDDGSKNAEIAISQFYLDDNMFSAAEFTVVPNTVGCVALSGVGINEAASAVSNLSFYPNPTSANGTISLSLTESAKVNVVVLNAVGQTVYSTSVTANAGSNKVDVNLSNLSSGLYFYQVQVANKKAVTQKFVIEK